MRRFVKGNGDKDRKQPNRNRVTHVNGCSFDVPFSDLIGADWLNRHLPSSQVQNFQGLPEHRKRFSDPTALTA
jgi:hypothetical protein